MQEIIKPKHDRYIPEWIAVSSMGGTYITDDQCKKIFEDDCLLDMDDYYLASEEVAKETEGLKRAMAVPVFLTYTAGGYEIAKLWVIEKSSVDTFTDEEYYKKEFEKRVK